MRSLLPPRERGRSTKSPAPGVALGLGPLLVAATLAGACDGDGGGGGGFDCEPLTAEGLLVGACPEAAARLLPVVHLEGAAHGGGLDGPCAVEGEGLRCPAGDAGSVTLRLVDGAVEVAFVAARDAVVEGLEARGPARVRGATGWLSDGFQSWSQAGVVALAPPVAPDVLAQATQARGDGEVVRDGRAMSWTYTVVGGGGAHLLAGALSAKVFRPWAQITRPADETEDPTHLTLRVVSGATGEAVPVASGETLAGEPFFFFAGDELAAVLGAYGDAMPSRRSAHPVPADAGWNSWYELWDTVDEAAVRENAALARDALGELVTDRPLRVVVDDGWQVAWGDWQPNDKFPSGLDGLAADLRDQGFETGVWLAPLLVHLESQTAVDHPDWLVDGAVYRHLKNGDMGVLDVTNPEARAHLAEVISTIVSWGYSLLKIDFLFAGTFAGDRYADVTPMASYDLALATIREAAGEDTILLAVGAPGLASLPHVDAWRVGGDIALEAFGASWYFLPSQARSIASRVPFCQATLCDADPIVLRELAPGEVDVGGWIVALAGGALFLSDDLRVLADGRLPLGLDARRAALSIGAVPAVPVDLFPAAPPEKLAVALTDQIANRGSRHVVPQRWLLPDGGTLLLNVEDDPVEVDGVTVPGRSVLLAE